MNLLKDIGAGALQVLKTVAPTVLATASGPFAPLVAPVLAEIFGTKPGDSKGLGTALLNATPEQLMAARKAETEHIEKMKDLGLQEEHLAFDDLAGARAMQVAIRDPTVARLAWLMIGGFLAISAAQIFAMLYWASEMAAIPPTVWLQIGNISGYLANEAKQAAAFFFGSTAGSQAKDVTIAAIAKAP